MAPKTPVVSVINDLVPDITALPKDLQLLVRYARTMDSAIGVPGTRYRVGADAVVGLIPGIGDALSATVSLLILYTAIRNKIPMPLLLRMVVRTALDFGIGSVPVVGDIFDVAYKDKLSNVRTILEHRNARMLSLASKEEAP